MKPLKKFGQNYLTDKNIVNKLLSPLKINKETPVLEIGAGKGFISNELNKLSRNLFLLEIDTRVIEQLKQSFPDAKVIQADINKFDLKSLNIVDKLIITGNIPFNQTGNILFKLLEYSNLISESSLLIPLDIAKRIVANKKTKAYGILTVLFEYFSSAKLITKVSKNVFFPKPNIEGAIIHIEFNKKLTADIKNKLFIDVVKASFGNRRKTLYNSLRNSIFTDYDYTGLDSILTKRAEELNLEDFLRLTQHIQNQYDSRK